MTRDERYRLIFWLAYFGTLFVAVYGLLKWVIR